MKKWIIGSLILIALMVVTATVYGFTSDKEKKQAKTECTFVDNNKDGKCDTCGSTADKCKGECKATESKDCSKCPAAASCGGQKEAVVPVTEGTASSTPPCCAKK